SEGMPAQLPLEVSIGVESAVSDPGAPAAAEPVALTAPNGPVVPVVGGGAAPWVYFCCHLHLFLAGSARPPGAYPDGPSLLPPRLGPSSISGQVGFT
ncbi:hypothetical protein, partial [Nocardia cyriacigeorgica]|uniref:hypothetical protein n=1 Tax=Nocardia cyriacigeorgica TaxID=135487 RepID=UPI0024553419